MTKNKKLALIFTCLAIISSSLFIIFFIGFLTIPFEIEGLIINISTLIVTIISIFLAVIYSKDYQVKFLTLGKKFNSLILTSLNKFNISDEHFINKFIKERKKIYRQTGNIFPDYSDSHLFRSNETVEKILELYNLLLESIESKGGFVHFCESFNKKNFESAWYANHLMTNSLISHELGYLLTEVFLLTDYYIVDNGLSEEFTIKNNKNIKLLNKIYSPSLFCFKDEIKVAIKKLENALKIN